MFFVVLLCIFTLFVMIQSMAVAAPSDAQFASDYLVQNSIDITDNYTTIFESNRASSLGNWNGNVYIIE